jgi:hypothetical protein
VEGNLEKQQGLGAMIGGVPARLGESLLEALEWPLIIKAVIWAIFCVTVASAGNVVVPLARLPQSPIEHHRRFCARLSDEKPSTTPVVLALAHLFLPDASHEFGSRKRNGHQQVPLGSEKDEKT